MEVQTFIPTYMTKEKRKPVTKTTTLPSGEAFDYRRMRIRADLVDRLDATKPNNKSLTAFLNQAVASFLDTYK